MSDIERKPFLLKLFAPRPAVAYPMASLVHK